MTISLLVQQPLAPHAVRLGRLVFDISAPWQDYCPHAQTLLKPDEDIATTPFLHIHEIIERTCGTKFHANLTQSISALTGKKSHVSATVAAPKGAAHRLLNSGHYFEQVCQDPDVRAWFERAIKRGWDVFMVVGIVTLTDATVANRIETASQAQGAIEPPTTDIVTSGISSIIPGGNVLDSSIGGGHSTQNATNSTFAYPGDVIIAVEYRKVRYGWFNRRTVETAFLDRGNRWIVYGTGDRSDLVGDEDVVDADLAETTSKDDVDVECDTFILGSGEEFILVDQAVPGEFAAA